MVKAKDKAKKTKEKAEEPKHVEAEVAEVVEPRKPSDELKIVITMKGDRSIVGIQSPDCDPIFTPLEGGLAAVKERLDDLVASANAKWDANPKNPQTVRPEPPPAPPVSASRQSSRRATPAAEPAQPSMF